MNHYTVFSELTTGKLKALLSGNLHYKNILAMVQAVNTKLIHKNVLKSQVEQLVSEIDYKNLGYKEAEDFKVSTTPGRNADQVNIIIMPACVYKLDEPFNLPPPPDERSKMLLALFCDEFERIKVRVFHAVWESFDTSMISLDAYKAMVFIKTCFRSQRIVFQEHLLLFPAFKKHPDAYINYMLAFFIIKVQVYFSKTFKDALSEDIKTEDQLFDELYRIDPCVLKKFNCAPANYQIEPCTNIAAEPAAAETYSSNSNPLQELAGDEALQAAFSLISEKYNLKPETLPLFVKVLGKAKWNGNRNILGDAVYQFMQRKGKHDLPMLEGSSEVIATIISLLGIDDEGHPLSKTTIKTHLQPSKSDKRLKNGSIDKLELIN